MEKLERQNPGRSFCKFTTHCEISNCGDNFLEIHFPTPNHFNLENIMMKDAFLIAITDL